MAKSRHRFFTRLLLLVTYSIVLITLSIFGKDTLRSVNLTIYFFLIAYDALQLFKQQEHVKLLLVQIMVQRQPSLKPWLRHAHQF